MRLLNCRNKATQFYNKILLWIVIYIYCEVCSNKILILSGKKDNVEKYLLNYNVFFGNVNN